MRDEGTTVCTGRPIVSYIMPKSKRSEEGDGAMMTRGGPAIGDGMRRRICSMGRLQDWGKGVPF